MSTCFINAYTQVSTCLYPKGVKYKQENILAFHILNQCRAKKLILIVAYVEIENFLSGLTKVLGIFTPREYLIDLPQDLQT